MSGLPAASCSNCSCAITSLSSSVHAAVSVGSSSSLLAKRRWLPQGCGMRAMSPVVSCRCAPCGRAAGSLRDAASSLIGRRFLEPTGVGCVGFTGAAKESAAKSSAAVLLSASDSRWGMMVAVGSMACCSPLLKLPFVCSAPMDLLFFPPAYRQDKHCNTIEYRS